MNARTKYRLLFGSLCCAATLIASAHLRGQQDVELQEVGEAVKAIAGEKPLPIDDSDSEIVRLLAGKHNAALSELRIRHDEYRVGAVTDLQFLFNASQRLLDTKLELFTNVEEQNRILKLFIQANEQLEAVARQHVTLSGDSPANIEIVRYDRFRMQLKLARNKQEQEPN